jgi:membrane fusion protein (multidrug efflux system)
MKQALFSKTSVVAVCVVCAIGVWMVLRPDAGAAATGSPEVVASVHTVQPVRATLPLTVGAYGDVVPGQTVSISFPRAGQIAAMALLPGQRIAKGGLLARMTNDPAADIADQQARSALSLAEAEVQRTQALFALQLATTSQVDMARKGLDDARGNAAAQQKLGGAAESQTATAPFDGVVLSVSAAQGDRIAAGAPLLQFGRIDRMRVVVGIEPAERQRVRVGAAVALTVELSRTPSASTSAEPLSVSGQIANVQNLVDPKTQLVNAVVELTDSASSILVPGMHVDARIATGTQDGWLVPRQSVLTDDKGSYLFEVRNAVARRVQLTRITEQDAQVGVRGVLTESIPVVSLGNYELADGMKVKAVMR